MIALPAAIPPPASWADVFTYLPTLIMTAGAAGVWLTAYLKGWIISKSSHEEKVAECEGWKQLYLQERGAHEKTREALLTSAQQATASTDTSKLVVALVEAMHQKALHHDPQAAVLPPQP